MRPLLFAVRKEMKMKHENDGIWLTTTEFLEFFDGKGIPAQSEIEERKKKFGIIIENGKEKAISGKEVDAFLDKLLPKHDSNLKEWKGTVASKGKAKGKVRLIFVPEDCAELQKGEILVTNQTTPDFVPAMRRAAAIVTDEGGLTCHAAIVSRELEVPCIVGTKISTKILKNGEMIVAFLYPENSFRVPGVLLRLCRCCASAICRCGSFCLSMVFKMLFSTVA